MTTRKNTQNAFRPAEDAVDAGKAQIESVLKAGNEAATKGYEQAFSITQEQIQRASEAMFRSFEEAGQFNKANFEAVTQASSIAAKGVETFGREVMSFAQAQMDAQVAATKALFGARTLREAFDVQADFARNAFDKTLSESAKLTELSVKVANETIEPIQSQTNATVERVMKVA